jgi:hypothetical protein
VKFTEARLLGEAALTEHIAALVLVSES